MVQRRKFMDLVLDEDGLHTPEGTLRVTRITRALAVRNFARADSGESPSPAGIVGGALVGGAVAGPVGLVGGALLGSTIKRKPPENEAVRRSVSVTLIFESPELGYSTMVARDRLPEAEAFVAAVKEAAGLE